MIPRRIHYCWFGRGEMSKTAQECMASWHKYMPNWEYVLWNEDNFDMTLFPYAREAYEARRFAFVSDVVRLYALKRFGGVYLDTDVLAYKSFDPLLKYTAFAGFEGSKHCPVGTCIIGSEANGEWVSKQLAYYEDRRFVLQNGEYDLTTNVSFITRTMIEGGFVPNGVEQDWGGIHVFPVDYFSPRHTTGEYIRTERTFCDHLGLASWMDSGKGWKSRLLARLSPTLRISIIKMKRKLFG